MSEPTAGATPPENEPESGATGAPIPSDAGKSVGGEKKTGKARNPRPKRPFVQRWIRRFYLAIPIFVMFLIALRVALVWLLPPAINKAAGRFGLECHYDKLDMSLLGGDFGIWHVKVTPIGSDKALAAADYCRLDVSTLALLRGEIHVNRLEADGADVDIERDADGSIPLLVRFSGAAPAPGSPAAAAPSIAAPRSFDLAPPLAIDSIRVSHVQAHLTDKAVTPAVSADLSLDFWLDDLGSTQRPTAWGADVRLWPLVDVVHVEGHGTTSATTLSATVSANVRGIHPEQAAAYLRGLGIVPLGQTLAASMQGTVNASVVPAAPGVAPGLNGSLALSSLELTVDGKPSASAGNVSITIDSFSAGKLVISKVAMDAGRVSATHTSRGTIVAAGLELGGTPPAAAPQSVIAPPAVATSPGGLTSIELQDLNLHDLQAALHDEAPNPPADLVARLDDFAIKNVIVGSAGGSGAITFGGILGFPGVCSAMTIDGSLSPWGTPKSALFKLDATGVNPTALATYLRPLGIESQLRGGELKVGGQITLSQSSDGGFSGGASLKPVVFSDGQELLSLDSVDVAGLTLSADATRIGMKQLQIAGPRTRIVHEADGAWRAMGFRFDPGAVAHGSAPMVDTATANSVAAGAPPVGAGAPAIPLPRVQIDQLTWGSVQLGFTDEGQNPPASVTISDAGLELKGLVLDSGKSAMVPAATVRGWVSVDGIAKRLEMAGNVTAALDHPAADVQVDGTGLNLAALEPYLRGMGVEPLVKQGELHLHAGADVVMKDAKTGEPVVSATLSKVSFADGADALAGLESLKLDGLSVGDATNGIHVAGFSMTGAYGSASREADGSLVVAGIRVNSIDGAMPGAATMPAAVTSAKGQVPAARAPDAAAGATAARVASPWRPLPLLPLVSVGKVSVDGAKLTWSDRADGRTIDTAVTTSVQSDGIVIGKDNAPSAIKVQLKVDGAVDSMAIDVHTTLGREAQSADVEVTGSGLRAGPLAGYVPAGMKVDLADGRLHAKLSAAVAPNAAGGMSGSVTVSDVDYRDGDAPIALLRVGSLRAAIARIDPVGRGNVIDVGELDSDGVEAQLHIAGGVVQAMGVTIGAAEAKAVAANATTKAATQVAAAATQAVVTSAKGQTTAAAPSADAASAEPASAPVGEVLFDLRHLPPMVTLDKLDLNLARLSITDSDLGGAPVVVSSARVWSDGKLTLLSPHPETLDPAIIKMTTAIEPAVKAINVETALSLFLPEPAVKLDVTATGISGGGIAQVLPKLKDQVDFSGLSDGRFKTHVEGSAKLERRGAFDIDWSRTITAQVNMQPIEFRDGISGPVLAGVDQIEVGNASVNPRTLDVEIGTLDITKPAAHVWKDQAGTHVLGLVIPDQMPAVTSAPGPTTMASTVAAPVAKTAATGDAEAASGPEVRIDRLTVSGLDFEYRDMSVTPPMIIPLTDLNMNVQNLSSRVMTQSTPVVFSVDVRSGKVELPKRQSSGPLVLGAVSGIASMIGNLGHGSSNTAPTETGTEQRDLFDDINADGAIAMYPQPKGTVRANINAVEMAEFKGLAASKGFTVEGGLFDGRFNAVLPGNDTLTSESKVMMTNAQMSEPPHGPIQSLFLLKLPLDATIALIQDANGVMTIPLNFTTSTKSISGGAITNVVVQTVGQSVETAVTSAPEKAIDQVFPLSDLLKQAKEVPIVISFDPADTALNADAQKKLAALEKRLKNGEQLSLTLQGDLGGGDVATAWRRIDLSPAESTQLAAQLRAKKVQLTGQRQMAAESARAELATGSTGEASTTVRQLAALDRELGETEDALDNLYDLLRPGAEQIVARRVRQACIDMGDARLATLQAALVSAGGPKVAGLIHVNKAQFGQPVGDGGGRITIVIKPQ